MSDKGIVEIDPNNLDLECIDLPTQHLRYSNLAAEKNADVDELEAELDVLKSDLDMRIRQTPGAYGIENLTEPSVKAAIVRSPKHQELLKRIREAKHDVALAKAMVAAIEVKKRSLTLLVELHSAGYHADVKVSHSAKVKVAESARRSAMTRHSDYDPRPRRREDRDSE